MIQIVTHKCFVSEEGEGVPLPPEPDLHQVPQKLAAKVTSLSAGMVFLSSTKLTDRQGRVELEVAWLGFGFIREGWGLAGCGRYQDLPLT